MCLGCNTMNHHFCGRNSSVSFDMIQFQTRHNKSDCQYFFNQAHFQPISYDDLEDVFSSNEKSSTLIILPCRCSCSIHSFSHPCPSFRFSKPQSYVYCRRVGKMNANCNDQLCLSPCLNSPLRHALVSHMVHNKIHKYHHNKCPLIFHKLPWHSANNNSISTPASSPTMPSKLTETNSKNRQVPSQQVHKNYISKDIKKQKNSKHVRRLSDKNMPVYLKTYASVMSIDRFHQQFSHSLSSVHMNSDSEDTHVTLMNMKKASKICDEPNVTIDITGSDVRIEVEKLPKWEHLNRKTRSRMFGIHSSSDEPLINFRSCSNARVRILSCCPYVQCISSSSNYASSSPPSYNEAVLNDVFLCKTCEPLPRASLSRCKSCQGDDPVVLCNISQLFAAKYNSKSPTSETAKQMVLFPEPIRVARSNDPFNSLKTCLVPIHEIRNYVQSAPEPRNWRILEKPSPDGYAFTLISYNVLSPNYATQSQYPYCPSYAMDWEFRRRSILEELRNYNASIICLQELDTNQFDDVFKVELAKQQYDGVFIPKSRSRTMDASDCRKVDGCAIFWKRDNFEKICEFHHEFMLSCSNVSETPAPLLVNRVMTRDNVALGVVFETKGQNPQQFCVTTGHIHWDPEHSDVKVIQTIMWTAELWAYLDAFFSQNLANRDNRNSTRLSHDISSPNNPLVTGKPLDNSPAARMPVIMCGDFNSLPTSGVVEFLLNGRLNKKHAEFLDYGFKYMFEDWKMLEKWCVDGDIVRHRFDFDRAHYEGQGIKFTNYTYDFKGMIDYVFFTKRHLRLLGSLDQVPESYFQDNRVMGCPHVHMPSDHFPLFVELELISETESGSAEINGISEETNSSRNQKPSLSAPNSTNKLHNLTNKRGANGSNDASLTPGSKFGSSMSQRNTNNSVGKQMRYNNNSTSDKK